MRIWAGIGAVTLAVIAFTAAVVGLLSGGQQTYPPYLASSPSGSLLSQPLVVPGAESFIGGQRQAAEAARRANPQAVAARERSRTVYSQLSYAGARRLLGRSFPQLVTRASGAPALPAGARIVGYPSAHAVQLALPGHRLGIAESTWPLAKRASNGSFTPIDLSLVAKADGYGPTRSNVDVQIPARLSDGVRTSDNGVTLTPVDASGPLSGHGAVDGATVVYPDALPAADAVVKPTPTGYQMDDVLRSADSPQQLSFAVSAGAPVTLDRESSSGDVRVSAHGKTLATILAPGATDAAGTAVPASMSVAGDRVVVSVPHRSGSYLYPIDVDPEINDSQLATTTAGKRTNWEFKSSNESRFGHKEVYEGPGKERLETSGIAEYGASEFAYWGYETKGNSKIYEVKTKTSAKNTGNKIESFLELLYPVSETEFKRETQKMLSTQFEEPEYSEKAATICALSPGERPVEQCLPTSGKEKNAVHFQQSATASPGRGFEFSDSMSEGIVSISEPTGEHSTTSFNTTLPEVEGKVEGKMQKRVNALYGPGIWLTKFKGALQLEAKDPGIGVSATRLEYEKSAGSWETLSSHNYLETEHACKGVQCYAEHAEYWTVDPKLPDGEDKIRYRAEEAIAETISPAGETESTKTVKVDTSAPHGISLSGLPYGEELSEKPYKLSATAIDGIGATVASSGIKRIALFVSGTEVAEMGAQTGCTVAKGECVAKAEWSINGAELGAGHHAIVVMATDNAGNEARIEETISIRHSTPVAMGPGSVDLQSGDFALGTSDIALGSGLNLDRSYSSRALQAGDEGPLGPQWNLNLGITESVTEMVDGSVLLTDAKGQQVIFATLGEGKFESPEGDSNLTLKLEENKTTKEKLAYYLEDLTKHTKTKFTLPNSGSKMWVPSKQEGTVATDTVSYTFRTVESRDEYSLSSGSRPCAIIMGPDGNLWFTDYYHIGKITRAGAVTEYAVPTAGGWVKSITLGPDGNLWFNTASAKIGKISTTGIVTEYSLPAETQASGGLVAGPDGNIWFTDYYSFYKVGVGKITPSGTTTVYALPSGSAPVDITDGPDGNLWFTENEKVAKITTSGTITAYPMPAWGKWPDHIAAGLDGNLWFTNTYGEHRIGKITTSGSVTGYMSPAGSEPTGIAPGPDGNVWFVDTKHNKVGKITKSGTITEYSIPSGSEPEAIATGADGRLWFTNIGTGRIGTITTSGGIITEPTEVLAPVPTGVSCSPMKPGCRALKFSYAETTSAIGENKSEWGSYKGRLQRVFIQAYSHEGGGEVNVAEYRYDKLGRLRAEWDPRISPNLETTYGYDAEGRVTAITPPGGESWAFSYGTTAADAGTGRLLKVTRASASESLWSGEVVKSTEAPTITGSPVIGVRMAVSNGKWSGSPSAYSYQWMRCNSGGEACAQIAGANNANYTPVSGDLGHKLMASVTATNGGGSEAAVSGATGEVKNGATYSVVGGVPRAITTGPDGNLWLADSVGKIDKVTTAGVVTKYSVTGSAPAYGITTGPDGNLWFTDVEGKVGKITTSGVSTEYAVPAESAPFGITAGPDGNLWFAEYKTSKIGRITTSGSITEFALPAGSAPFGIVAGPDGNLWFTEYKTNKIGKITTSGSITEYALPTGSVPEGITKGPDEKLWFAEHGTNKIGKITTSGSVTEYTLLPGSGPQFIATDSNNNLSFTNYSSSKIGSITTSGTVTEYGLAEGHYPEGIVGGPEGNLWYTIPGSAEVAMLPPGVTAGASQTPSAGTTLEYNVPLSGSGLPNMSKIKVEQWAQTDLPVEGTAIMPPDARQGWPASSYARATIYYLDARGRTVNIASPTENWWYGSIATMEYNEMNDVVRTLSPGNRLKALEEGGKSVDVARLLSTYYTYRGECSTEAENKHEAASEESGARLCDVQGPQHEVKYIAGGKQEESLARLHTKYFYDENSPGGAVYNLVTKTSTLAQLANEEEVEVRKTTTSYSGQSNLGWTLRAPTSVTVDPEGKKLTTTTLYNEATAQITETRSPAGRNMKTIYYGAEANTEGYGACGNHPEWAGLVCETLPAKQPASGPELPVTITTYNIWNEPEVTTETIGATVRTEVRRYDEAGRLFFSEKTSPGAARLYAIDEYNPESGVGEVQWFSDEKKFGKVTSKYDRDGRLTEYTDEDGAITKYRYGGPENDGLLEEVTDGSDSGTGRQTYTYNPTTKLRDELWDSAAGTFTASYDIEGNLQSEVYPNGMCANDTYNSVGEATHIEYIKTSHCGEHEAPVWYSETRSPSVRGVTFGRTSTLASETYTYDTVGRLTETQETPTGEGCSVRLYAYDEESNRTSQTTRTPAGGGKCATEGGTVLEHVYDEGNHLADSGVSYDSFGNMIKVPAADAEGHELSSTFYVDNAIATQTQNGVTNSYLFDPEGRVRETVSGTTTTITHYDGPGEASAWTSEGVGKSTRNIPGIDGSLSATQTNEATPVLQLHDLQGDVVATAALSTSETKLLSTYNSTEFGVPNAEKVPPKFAWLGAGDIASALPSGVVTYGATSYVPQIGRALQSEAVEPPGAPGGTGAGAQYNSQEEPWAFQGAAAAGAEAPGREAARERAAAEVAAAAAAAEENPTGHDPSLWISLTADGAKTLAVALKKSPSELVALAKSGTIRGFTVRWANLIKQVWGEAPFGWNLGMAAGLNMCVNAIESTSGTPARCKFKLDYFDYRQDNSVGNGTPQAGEVTGGYEIFLCWGKRHQDGGNVFWTYPYCSLETGVVPPS